jgi:GC-rich sequence DNA-binding factor
MKIIQNILRWREFTGEKLGIGGLIERLITTSALPVAATGWEVGGESCTRKVRLFIAIWSLI